MTSFIFDPKKQGASTSSGIANNVYKRSWRDIFVPSPGGMPQMPKTTGRLVENDVAMEILKNRIPTATCKSLRKERFGFRTFSTSPAITISHGKETQEMQTENRFLFDRSHPLRK
jgi:hypothetical protein